MTQDLHTFAPYMIILCLVGVLPSAYHEPVANVACVCVTENAPCSTIICADGWSADSSAAATKCAGPVCDAAGLTADNALCCNGATYLLLMTFPL